MLIMRKKVQIVDDNIEIPDGEGREDCSCGAVIKEASQDAYDFAVKTIDKGCVDCRALFFPEPKAEAPAPDPADGTVQFAHQDQAVLHAVEPSYQAPVAG